MVITLSVFGSSGAGIQTSELVFRFGLAKPGLLERLAIAARGSEGAAEPVPRIWSAAAMLPLFAMTQSGGMAAALQKPTVPAIGEPTSAIDRARTRPFTTSVSMIAPRSIRAAGTLRPRSAEKTTSDQSGVR